MKGDRSKTSGFENYWSATVFCHSFLSEVKAWSSARSDSNFKADLSEYKSKPKEEAEAHSQPSEATSVDFYSGLWYPQLLQSFSDYLQNGMGTKFK